MLFWVIVFKIEVCRNMLSYVIYRQSDKTEKAK